VALIEPGDAARSSDGAAAPGDALARAPDLAHFVCVTQGARDCTPGMGLGTPDQCTVLPMGVFHQQVTNAIDQVMKDHPAYFDFSQGNACCPLVVQVDAYTAAVVANVNGAGLCCESDPNDAHEISVKLQNDCAENHGIITSMNYVRNPPKYQGTCDPAYF
jgi:hypothetical protein